MKLKAKFVCLMACFAVLAVGLAVSFSVWVIPASERVWGLK